MSQYRGMPQGIKLLAFTLACACLLLACSQKDDSLIRVGLAGPMTGPDGQMGASIIAGSQMAIDEWNARGGVLGKKIVAVTRDDEAKPDKAVTVARDLVANKVVGVIGHLNGGCTMPASTIYAAHKIPEITFSSNPLFTDRNLPTLFRAVWR
jgi:branched-chain amino acid transport system substrate-binding protein